MRGRILSGLTVLWVLSWTVTSLADPAYFLIEIDNRPIGYASAELQRDESDQTIAINSETFLKIALLGTERRTLLQGMSRLTAEGRPVSFDLTATINDLVTRTETRIDGEKAVTGQVANRLLGPRVLVQHEIHKLVDPFLESVGGLVLQERPMRLPSLFDLTNHVLLLG